MVAGVQPPLSRRVWFFSIEILRTVGQGLYAIREVLGMALIIALVVLAYRACSRSSKEDERTRLATDQLLKEERYKRKDEWEKAFLGTRRSVCYYGYSSKEHQNTVLCLMGPPDQLPTNKLECTEERCELSGI